MITDTATDIDIGPVVTDTDATEDLITRNIALVGHIVRETLGRVPAHIPRDDLSSAGMAALVMAARGFDSSRGVPFARYAATRIRGALIDELRGVDWASRSVRRRARDLDAARGRLSSDFGRPATDDEVAGSLGLRVEDVAANRGDVARASLVSINGLGDATLEDLLPHGGLTPEQVVEQRERITYLREAIQELPERLRGVVQDYFFGEQPMADIAARLGVTESRVSQMRGEAITLLRGALSRALEPEQPIRHDRPDGCAARRREAYFAAVLARHSAGQVRSTAARATA